MSTKKDTKAKEDAKTPDKVADEKVSAKPENLIDEKALDAKLDGFFERIVSYVKKYNTTTEATSEKITQAPSMHLGEIGNPGSIERVSEKDFVVQAELEKFMNEVLTILVHQGHEEGAYDVITPNVNGINMPIIRGREAKVKRKYVEALARSRITKYTQQQDQRNLENIAMLDNTVLTYPFAVLHDPHPHGAAWLDAIINQR